MKSSWGISARATTAERLDQALMRTPFSMSRRGAKKAMEAGKVIVEGTAVAVASRAISPGMRISLVDEESALPILHRGDDFVIVDKPPVLPAQIPNDTDAISALEVLASQLRREGERRTVKIVHRLDTNTTGAMAFALGDPAAARLAGKLQSRQSRKIYVAIVAGRIEEPREITEPIDRIGPREFGVRDGGRPARTGVVPLHATDTTSLVAAELFTGRTHQIRVHFASIGHPILGDRKYGGAVAETAARPMLHAWRLQIEGEGEWTVELPEDMRTLMEREQLEWNGRI